MAETGPNAPRAGAQQEIVYEEPLTTDSMGPNANTYRGQVIR